MKKILGITGGIGSGKSLVSKMFKELGATIVDADKIAKEILEPDGAAFKEVICSFGGDILKADHSIDRKKLAGIVFNDDKKLNQLNAITHPTIFKEMKTQVNRAETKVVCLDVPLLFTSNFPISCHKTLAVIASENVRIERVMNRDGCTEDEVKKRIKKQLSNDEFRKKADICIQNDGDETALREKVLEIYTQLME